MAKNFTVWYMRPDFFRDGTMGYDWAKERGFLDGQGLEKTHIELGVFSAENEDDLFRKMQGEVWSPNGEARPLIRSKGLEHTSMSVGDAFVDEEGVAWMVDRFGFKRIGE